MSVRRSSESRLHLLGRALGQGRHTGWFGNAVSGPARRTDAKLALLSGAVVAATTELGARLG
ncbi:hypothetical protein ABZ820_21345 [Streptomyces diacarni]|uniref:hypothetical protein n=1 Tax=Streptomyces diacarni TaxID=2800381 RepID=UPI0033D63722